MFRPCWANVSQLERLPAVQPWRVGQRLPLGVQPDDIACCRHVFLAAGSATACREERRITSKSTRGKAICILRADAGCLPDASPNHPERWERPTWLSDIHYESARRASR